MFTYIKYIYLILLNLIYFSYGNTEEINNGDNWDNATWVLNSAFVIITMQSGFGLLESGTVTQKNSINIMMKNLCDIIFGGIIYWIFGYGLIFGDDYGENGFTGIGKFFFDADITVKGGWEFSRYFFQLTFATTATTIVSGALAERLRFSAYCFFSCFNTIIYCITAHWIFNNNGWLKKLGVIDFAGAGPVHLLGGVTSFIGTLMVGKRIDKNYQPSSLNNILLGLFLLWWGWLGFNCGSSFGITGKKWIYVAKAASTTINSSIAGGLTGFYYCVIKKIKYDIILIVNAILSSLVAITPCCIHIDNWVAYLIGFTSALISTLFNNKIKNNKYIDDPLGCIGTHGISSIWGLICTGLFVKENYDNNYKGLIYSGSFNLLLIELLEIISIITWVSITSYISFFIVDKIIGLRLTQEEEKLGNDFLDHGIDYNTIDILPNIVNNSNNNIENINANNLNFDKEMVNTELNIFENQISNTNIPGMVN